MRDLDGLFAAFAQSKFRTRFRLGAKETAYLNEKTLAVVLEHGKKFVVERLADAQPRNDGRQTPMRGHPVFVAQHATATCCRGCLAKWHRIPEGKPLTQEQVEYVVAVLERWLSFRILGSLRVGLSAAVWQASRLPGWALIFANCWRRMDSVSSLMFGSRLLYVYDYGFNPPCRVEVLRITLEKK